MAEKFMELEKIGTTEHINIDVREDFELEKDK